MIAAFNNKLQILDAEGSGITDTQLRLLAPKLSKLKHLNVAMSILVICFLC
jgi:hypothetical protein